MRWEKLSKIEAEKVINSWNGVPNKNCKSEYSELRNDFLQAFDESLKEINLTKESLGKYGNIYKFDVIFGLKLFGILENIYDVNPRTASDNEFWIYLSVNVVPDVVYYRWGTNPGRFFSESRRIWLKALWWYVYLSWQGNVEDTYGIIANNTTDEIVQLVERSGLSGYRVDVSREIMRYYGSLDNQLKSRNGKLFRKVMKLNIARTKVIEPGLVDGGVNKYVEDLFKYFET